MLPFAGLVNIGTIMIVFRGYGPELFSFLAFLLAMPSILMFSVIGWTAKSFETVDWLEAVIHERVFVVEMPLPLGVGLGLVIITGYLALSYLHKAQKDYGAFMAGEAEISEAAETTRKDLIIMAVLLGISVAITVVLVVLLNLLQSAAADYLEDLSGGVILIGVVAVLVLAGFVYWIGASVRKQSE